MASTYLSRTPSSSSNRRTWTWSAWVKRSNLSTGNQVLFQALDGSFPEKIQFTSSDRIEYDHDISGTDYTIYSEKRFRDVNGWYHIVVAKDTTQATETDRIKIYVNNEQVAMTEEALGYPPQNYEGAINKNVIHNLGANNSGSSEVFSGCMSHVHFVDGTALAPTVFGSTDSTTGEWKINTSPSYTVGTNGFFILKDGNSLTDQSANSNNFSLSNGTLTKTEDNPSNVFATWNPLVNPWSGATTWTYGNTRGYNSDSHKGALVTTLGATSGKYYMEIKQENANGVWIGVCGDGFVSDNLLNKYSGSTQDATTGLLIKYSDGTRAVNNNDTNNVFETTGSGDITGIALDLDAATKTVTFYKNGSADSAGSQNLPTNMQTGAVFGCAIVSGGAAVNLNAGNGYFANNAISSAGTNASGIGIFEHDVPANHTALSTKGLNE